EFSTESPWAALTARRSRSQLGERRRLSGSSAFVTASSCPFSTQSLLRLAHHQVLAPDQRAGEDKVVFPLGSGRQRSVHWLRSVALHKCTSWVDAFVDGLVFKQDSCRRVRGYLKVQIRKLDRLRMG